jgi:hypothetical protein
MAQALKDILKQAHDRIKGVHASQTTALSTGKDPGVDYEPKSGDEQDFIAKHSVQKWDDPNGNGDGVFTAQKGEAPYQKQSKGVYESKKAEDVKCNHSPAKTWCPIHEMADCSMSKNIKEEVEQVDEVSSKLLYRAFNKAKDNAGWLMPGDKGKGDKAWNRAKKFRDAGVAKQKKENSVKEDAEQIDELSKKTLKSYIGKATDGWHPDSAINLAASAANRMNRRKGTDIEDAAKLRKKAEKRGEGIVKAANKLAKEEVEKVDEVLTKSTTAGETIHDFVHSKNPKFAGKSKEKRKQMALAAYYAKQRSVKEDLAVPLLGGDQPPRGNSDEAVEMVKTELKALANKAMHLATQMPQGMHIEPWCQAKIAQAKSMVSDVHDYMVYGDHEEDEQTGPETPMTFPNMSVDVNTGRNV